MGMGGPGPAVSPTFGCWMSWALGDALSRAVGPQPHSQVFLHTWVTSELAGPDTRITSFNLPPLLSEGSRAPAPGWLHCPGAGSVS